MPLHSSLGNKSETASQNKNTFFVEMRSRSVAEAGLELLTSNDPPALASQTAGVTGVSPQPSLRVTLSPFERSALPKAQPQVTLSPFERSALPKAPPPNTVTLGVRI